MLEKLDFNSGASLTPMRDITEHAIKAMMPQLQELANSGNPTEARRGRLMVEINPAILRAFYTEMDNLGSSKDSETWARLLPTVSTVIADTVLSLLISASGGDRHAVPALIELTVDKMRKRMAFGLADYIDGTADGIAVRHTSPESGRG